MEALRARAGRSSPEAIKGQNAMPGTRGGDSWGISTAHIMVGRGSSVSLAPEGNSR